MVIISINNPLLNPDLCWVWGVQSCKCLCQDGDVSAPVDDVRGMSESERNEWFTFSSCNCFAANLQFMLQSRVREMEICGRSVAAFLFITNMKRINMFSFTWWWLLPPNCEMIRKQTKWTWDGFGSCFQDWERSRTRSIILNLIF